MTEHDFNEPYWDKHWQQAHGSGRGPNPHLARETSTLTPGTALDAGCGEGAEAIWLATHGWHVTAADISSEALARAASREGANTVEWVRADLTTWAPSKQFDLVMTHYAHPSTSQLDFYERLSAWVTPRGTLLVVGHLQGSGHGQHPAEATATAANITGLLDPDAWEIATADEPVRTVTGPDGRTTELHDVVVRATRR